MNNCDLSSILIPLSPAKRLKYIRQKLLKQNQQTFCADGIIRSGTLKSIEIERMRIGYKIADKLVHKLSLEGILCNSNIFLDKNAPCDIIIDTSKKELIGSSINSLEEIRKKITQLIPLYISTDEYVPVIPQGTTLLAYEASFADLKLLNNTLCLIKGDKSSLYYLTYCSDNSLYAQMNNSEMIIPINILDFCAIFVIEIIYFGKKI